MVDFHSHMLPGIDDGSKNMEETRELLIEECKQGVRSIIATPHFYADRDSVRSFLKHRSDCFQQLESLVSDWEEAPDIEVGAEVYYFPHMGEAELLADLCIGKTKVLLLEMPFVQWTEQIFRDVKNIVEKKKLTVILAHIERYYDFQKNREIWEKLLNLPIYIQINGGSFLDRKRRKFALRFLEEHPNVVLGSDCHNMDRRPPNLLEARKVIEKKMGNERLQQIDDLGKRILEKND